jgi:hypothetical protein
MVENGMCGSGELMQTLEIQVQFVVHANVSSLLLIVGIHFGKMGADGGEMVEYEGVGEGGEGLIKKKILERFIYK